MKTTIEIPDPLFRELRAFAARHSLSLKTVVERALRELLRGPRNGKPFRLKKASFRGEGLQSGASSGDWETVRAMIYEGQGG